MIEIVTKAELLAVKEEILSKIEELFSQKNEPTEYLKKKEVQQLLRCSASKVDALIKNGSLPTKKVMGTVYHKKADVMRLLEG